MNWRAFLAACVCELRSIGVSAAVGAAIGALYGAGQHSAAMPAMIAGGAFIGFCIYLTIRFLGIVFKPLITLVPERRRVFVEGLKYVIGGGAGWMAGVIVVNTVIGARHPIPAFTAEVRTFILIIAAVALVIGMLFRSFDTMTQRLRHREWAERELEIARSIQTRLLPPAVVSGDGFTIAARNLPAHYVAGDFYDVIRLDDGSVMVVLADVAGKGIGAGLIMSSVKAVLPFLADGGVAATINALNRKLSSELQRREFVALVCARYDPAAGTIEVANAGCPDPYLVSGRGVEAIHCHGVRLPLGVNSTVEYSSVTVRMEPGERLVLLSDGIPEAEEADGQPLGYDRLEQIIGALNPVVSGAAWLDGLLDAVRLRVAAALSDDWTVLVLERSAATALRRADIAPLLELSEG